MSKQKLDTPKPLVSEQITGMIRDSAARYVRAGGGLFLRAEDSSGALDDHIGNVCRYVFPNVGDEFDRLLATHVKDYAAHEAVWSAAWCLYAAGAESGFLFGAQTGCEFAAVLLGQPAIVTKGRAK